MTAEMLVDWNVKVRSSIEMKRPVQPGLEQDAADFFLLSIASSPGCQISEMSM